MHGGHSRRDTFLCFSGGTSIDTSIDRSLPVHASSVRSRQQTTWSDHAREFPIDLLIIADPPMSADIISISAIPDRVTSALVSRRPTSDSRDDNQ